MTPILQYYPCWWALLLLQRLWTERRYRDQCNRGQKEKEKKKGPKQVQKIENTVKATSPQYTKAEITGQSTPHENAANRPTPLMRDDRREILKEYI